MKKGWVTKKLGEVCEIIYGYPFDSKLFNDRKKGVPVIRIRDVVRGYSEAYTTESCDVKYRVESGDVLIGMDGDFNISSWKSSRALLNQRVCKLESGEKTTNRYLRYVLPTVLHDIWEKKLFATVKHLSAKDLNGISLPIPPLEEQKRIVAKIDAAFEKIDKLKANAEKNLANAKELFQSALDEAMRPKKGWVEKRLGEVCEKIGSGATPRGGKASYCDSGVALIRSMNVYDCFFEYSGLAHINKSQAKELDNVTIKKNDVLVNITGASIARCCVVPDDVLPARVNQHVSILRISESSMLSPEFLCFLLVAPSQKNILLKIGDAGSTRQALTKGDLSSFEIRFPDICKQAKIIDAVKELSTDCTKIQQNYLRQIADCAEMRQAVLREAFEGKL